MMKSRSLPSSMGLTRYLVKSSFLNFAQWVKSSIPFYHGWNNLKSYFSTTRRFCGKTTSGNEGQSRC